MKDIRRIHSVVEKVLIENDSARKNDNSLILGVLKELGLNVASPLNEVFKQPEMPSFESITRARRKLQSDNPALRDSETAQLRCQQEEIYKNYARGEL